MKKYLLLILFLAPFLVWGQKSSADSLLHKQQHKTVKAIEAGDSVKAGITHQLDSVQGSVKQLQARLDSLQRIGQETDHVQDSLQQLLQKGQVLQQKLKEQQDIVVTPLAKVNELQQQLPADQLAELGLPTKVLSEGVLPGAGLPDGLPDMALPEMQLPDMKLSGMELPGAQLPAIPLDGVNLQLPGLPQEGLPKIDSTTFSGKNIDKKLEEQLLKQKEVAGLQEQIAGDDPLKAYTSMDAKALALGQAEDFSPAGLSEPAEAVAAVDHFVDHKEALDNARRDLDKYKGRFSEIKSFKDLPKNPLKRHPLMGISWYKRVQPGLQWQMGKGEGFRIDIGPRVSYLVTDKLEIGASSQARISIGKAVPSTVSFGYERVLGYCFFSSYEIRKGFYGQVSYERLNTQKLKLPGQQEAPDERLWVEGLRLGLGKRYGIYKRLKGYSLMEYNFSPSIHAPYRQQFQVEVGMMWDRR